MDLILLTGLMDLPPVSGYWFRLFLDVGSLLPGILPVQLCVPPLPEDLFPFSTIMFSARKTRYFWVIQDRISLVLSWEYWLSAFCNLNQFVKGIAEIDPAVAFSVSLFILPLFDTIRVFSIRIAQGKSPFKADRQHIHHRMLELGFSHLQSTLYLFRLILFLLFFVTYCRILGMLF